MEDCLIQEDETKNYEQATQGLNGEDRPEYVSVTRTVECEGNVRIKCENLDWDKKEDEEGGTDDS